MGLAKSRAREQIQQGSNALRDLMQKYLSAAVDGMVAQIMKNVRSLPDSQRLNATKNISWSGMNEYRVALQDAMTLIAAEALAQARKEVPKAKGVQLGEWEDLPPAVRKKILAKSQLLIDTQYQDLEKAVYFQFQSSQDASDSMDMLEGDLLDAGESYVSGASISSGAGITSAQLINDVRSAFFYDDQVLDQIDGFVFVNGDPVTEICQDLAGTVFSKDDPGADQYQPPLHWNCKSSIQPILSGNLDDAFKKYDQAGFEPLEPSTAALKKQVQFHENCGGAFKIPGDELLRELIMVNMKAGDRPICDELAGERWETDPAPVVKDGQAILKFNSNRLFENGYERRVKLKNGHVAVYGKLKPTA